MSLSKDEGRGYGSGGQGSERYYSSMERTNHYYDEREMMPPANTTAMRRGSQEPPEPDRGISLCSLFTHL